MEVEYSLSNLISRLQAVQKSNCSSGKKDCFGRYFVFLVSISFFLFFSFFGLFFGTLSFKGVAYFAILWKKFASTGAIWEVICCRPVISRDWASSFHASGHDG